MGRAIDLFVTYRFIKLLVTPFEKTDAYKLGVIDEKGNRIMPPPKGGVRQTKPASLNTTEEKNSYTILHKLVQPRPPYRDKIHLHVLQRNEHRLGDS